MHSLTSWLVRRCAAASLASMLLLALFNGEARAEPAAHKPLAFEPSMSAVQVRMRDGVSLAAHIWLPAQGKKHPTILLRNPYGLRYGPDGDIFKTMRLQTYVDNGYAVVIQDTRGTGDSAGVFTMFSADAQDGYDTIEWLAGQSWSNGRIAMDGLSYLGTVQWLAASQQPAHLKCIAPTAPAGNPFGELPFLGGALRLQWALPYLSLVLQQDMKAVDWPRVLAHRPLNTADSLLPAPIAEYRAWLAHPTLDDYWRRMFMEDADFARVGIPFRSVTGWFDDELRGTLRYWNALQAAGSSQGSLIIGPWDHLQTYVGDSRPMGLLSFPADAAIDLQAERLAFFDRCLKGNSAATVPPRVRVFITGSNEWRSFDSYPPPQVQRVPFYLHSAGRANTRAGNGTLSRTAPANERTDTYQYDPKKPVPYLGSAMDVASNEQREDVLVYTSDVLREPLTILGPVEAVLYAATDARDTDWVVKLVDVRPDGTAIGLNHSGGVLRARYRQGYDREVLLRPGAVEKFDISVWDLGHTFLPGHRLRLHVTSSAYPLINPNQNTGNPVASDVEWRIAKQTVHHDRASPSHVLLPVLSK